MSTNIPGSSIPITVDPVFSRTWRWLRVNDRKTQFPVPVEEAAFAQTVTGSIDHEAKEEAMATSGAAGEDFANLLAEAPCRLHEFTPKVPGSTLWLSYGLTAIPAASAVSFNVPEASSMTCVMDLSLEEAMSDGALCLSTNVEVGPKGQFTLVQIYRAGASFHTISDIFAVLAKDASMTLIQLVLSGKENDLPVTIHLNGDRSQVNIYTAYVGEKNSVLDFNYYLPHQGKHSTSAIEVGGVLKDSSAKVFRGVIDFLEGSSGAKGAEQEEVLLLSDTVRNQSMPVILCHEEDVEGSHGASIGKIDDAVLFYLQSRGLPEEAVYQMLSDAKVMSAVHKITDPSLRQKVEELI